MGDQKNNNALNLLKKDKTSETNAGAWSAKTCLSVASAALAISIAAPHQASAQTGFEDEIVVTGEKRGKSVQDTATSIEIVTTQDIQELNIVDLEDALRRVGNAGFATVGSGANDQFVLRGVQSGGVTPGETAVATLVVDGAFIPNQAAGATISNAWDVTQIEILRGAQSTLQGRNSLIGAIVVNTQDPTNEIDLKGRATYAEYGTWETSIAVGGPIIDDELMFRIAAQHLESDGFVERTDGSDGDREYSTLVRGKLRVEPEWLPNFSWDLVATYSVERDGSVLVSGENPEARLQTTDVRTLTDREILTLGSELTYEISDSLTFYSVSSFANLKTDEIDDFDGLPDQGGAAESPFRDNTRDSTDWIQELRLLYTADRFQVLFGGLYARRFSDDETRVVNTFPVPSLPLTALSIFDPSFDLNQIYLDATSAASGGTVSTGLPADAPLTVSDQLFLGDTTPVGSDFNFNPDFTTIAIFGEGTYDVTEAFSLTFGFRYEREQADYSVVQFNQLLDPADILAVSPTGNPGLIPAIESSIAGALTPSEGAASAASIAAGAAPLIAPQYGSAVQSLVLLAGGFDESAFEPLASGAEFTFNVFMPKFVARYDFTDSISLSASAQRAYRPGGIGVNPVRLAVFNFEPEFSWNYELAFRSRLLDGKLLLNANVFYIDWSDQQIEIVLSDTPQDTVTDNVGSSELYGMEIQATYDVTEDLELFASIGVIQTEITDADASNADLIGSEFPFAPRYSGSA
ncbi:MAG: TonB-dependent receptor, partial [Pseudomonadota bacterium]